MDFIHSFDGYTDDEEDSDEKLSDRRRDGGEDQEESNLRRDGGRGREEPSDLRICKELEIE